MNNFDTTIIENSFKSILKTANAASVIYTNRPKSTVKADAFAVVSVASPIEDYSVYGECVVSIDLFAKDVENLKNGAKLAAMYQKLRSGLPTHYEVANSIDMLIDTDARILADVPDDFGFHARMIEVKVTIKVK